MDPSADPLGFGNFNAQALHPDEQSMAAGNLPARPQHAYNGPKGFEGWLVRNAPTIGGTIGAVAAAPLNLLDAVSGVGGTALDVGAAGLGATLGQEIKNKYDPGESTNAVKEGAIQGATELAGLGAGKIVSKGVGALKNAAPDLFKEAFNVPSRLVSRLKPQQTAQDLVDYGVHGSLNKMLDTSNSALDVLDGIYRQSLAGVKGEIDTNPAIDAAKGVINDPLTNFIQPGDEKKIYDTIANAGINGSAPGLSDAENLVDHMRNIQKIGYNLVRAGSDKTNPDRRLIEQGQAYLAAGDKMQSMLDAAAGTQSVKVLQTPENEAALKEISPKLAQKFMTAKSPQEVRSLMAPFMSLRTMANMTLDRPKSGGYLARAIGGIGGFGLGGFGGAAAGMLGSPVIEGIENRIAPSITTGASKAVNAMAKGAEKLTANEGKKVVGNLTTRDIVGKAVNQSVGQGIGELVGQPELGAALGAGLPSLGGSGGNSAGGGGGPVSSSVGNMVAQTTSALKQATNKPAPIQQLTPDQIQSILASSGTEGLRAIEDSISTNLAVQKQESPELSGDQQNQIADITKSLQGITDAAQLYDQAYALGAGTGKLAELGTHIPGIQNTKAESALRAYEDNRGDLAAQIATVLGSGRSSARLLSEIKSELPSATDSPMAAQAKFAMLVQRLNAALGTTLQTPATNTPGQLTNFAGQNVPGLQISQPPVTNNLGLLNFIGATQ